MENRKRVRYEKSPLVEVIFQLRFPTILSINKTQPADYQERVRARYPFFQENIEQQGEVVIGPNVLFRRLNVPRRIEGGENGGLKSAILPPRLRSQSGERTFSAA